MTGRRCFIIAEAGVNHNGSVETAELLCDAAARAGADAIKFQSFRAELMTSRSAPKAEYQARATGREESHLEMIRKLELDPAAHAGLIGHCRKIGIDFISSPFDLESIDLLAELGLPVLKIPSGEITNLPYLRRIGNLGRRIILSTGMSDLEEVEKSLDVLVESGTPRKKITILHCNTEYPSPYEDVNLRAMITMREALQVDVGYSDHTEGIEIALAAVALGASVIEKHFTLDRNMPGPDHKASIEPEELRRMVKAIRNVEKALGDGVKRPSASESKNRCIARKSMVALRAIRKGEVFTPENVTVKRPGTGISPMEWDRVMGNRAKRGFREDELIEL